MERKMKKLMSVLVVVELLLMPINKSLAVDPPTIREVVQQLIGEAERLRQHCRGLHELRLNQEQELLDMQQRVNFIEEQQNCMEQNVKNFRSVMRCVMSQVSQRLNEEKASQERFIENFKCLLDMFSGKVDCYREEQKRMDDEWINPQMYHICLQHEYDRGWTDQMKAQGQWGIIGFSSAIYEQLTKDPSQFIQECERRREAKRRLPADLDVFKARYLEGRIDATNL
jgi:hypothetical protein